VGPGDEVLVPSLTFVATVNAILYLGADPVFIDIESIRCPHLSLMDAKKKITEKTRAVIVMHYGGYLVDLSAWRSFADENNLFLIEDAAHAPAVGKVGHISDAACFSFFSNKNMTTAEGGMVVAKRKDTLDCIRKMRTHGMTTVTLDRHRGHAFSYDVTMLGYNYRMDELRAAMGIVQLTYLKQWNKRRRELTEFYRKKLAESLPQIIIPFDKEHKTAAHLLPILLPASVNREQIMTKLNQAGIQSSIHYQPVHKFSYYLQRFPGVNLPKTEQYADRVLTLPLHPALNENHIQRIVDTLHKVMNLK
jgi:dTDP-4-amino-4,6-dideoxygalactose transaminase